MIIFSFFVSKTAFNLSELPSPAYVHWQLAHKLDKPQYKVLLTKSKVILDRFTNLSEANQGKAIREWVHGTASQHLQLSSQGIKRPFFDTQYEFSEAMSQVDLAKLDVLYLYKGLKPVFHTEVLLRALYSTNIQDGTEFRIDPGKGWPTKISFGFHSGPRAEPRSASFDRFSSIQLEVVLKWINSNGPIRQLEPMTFPKMIDRIARYEHKS